MPHLDQIRTLANEYSAFVGSGLILLLVALAHLYLRSMSQTSFDGAHLPEMDPDGASRFRGALTNGVRRMAAPAALLLWVYGLQMALMLLLADEPGPAGERLRVLLRWSYGLAMLAGLVWLLTRLGRAVEDVLVALAAHSASTWDDVWMPQVGVATRRLLPLLALILGTPALSVSPELAQILTHASSLGVIGVVAFIAVQLVNTAAAYVLRHHRLDAPDNLHARAVHTQVAVFRKAGLTLIGLFTLASVLMVFEPVRQFGASILASAGIAGLIIGFAAQRGIATLFAGLQVALTQPIRVDDVVVVEGEWGRIEEITLTYVVVHLWDKRRLVVPVTQFIEKPFQNWTRRSSDIVGTVLLRVDYSVPVDPLRAELTRILQASPLWDGAVNVLQVTDANERTVEVRALVSASDAGRAWDLRCEVREKLIGFLYREYPDSLPHVRTTGPPPPDDAPKPAAP